MTDHGNPASYLTLEVGTPVVSSDEQLVGTVEHVLAAPDEDIFDGLVVETDDGRRFVDAPEVKEIFERGVVLSISGAQAAALPEPAENPATLSAGPDDTVPDGLGDKLKRAWDLISGNYLSTRLDLEYDGTRFAGWARQPGLRTVQEELEGALATVLREPVALTVGGRTDTGVHAWGQVASYGHEAVDPRRLNSLLPDDVAVLAATPAHAGFDARRDAVSRTYCYRVLARRERSAILHDRALWWPRPLDRDALHACAAALRGPHDFTAFTPTDTRHSRFERDIRDARWESDGDVLELWITADTFMRHMNRILVGTMLDVAVGNRTVEDFAALLEGAPRSRAAQTAPPHGLALASIAYA